MRLECSVTNISNMKNESFVYPARIKSSENLSLRRILNALDHERRFKIQELDTKKKQFLHEHRTAAIRRNGNRRPPPANSRCNMRERIERKMEEEKQSLLDLQSRSMDFINELRVKPLSTLIKMDRKPSLVEMNESSKMKRDQMEAPQPSTTSKVIALYQKGLSGVLSREREIRTSPFVQSVNAILENLKDSEEKEGNKRDPMKNFTRNILSKYAGLNVGGEETISEESETVSDNASLKNVSPDCSIRNNADIGEEKIEADADEYVESTKHSSKGLQLWARVRREQNSVRLSKYRDHRDVVSNNEYENTEELNSKEASKSTICLAISKSRASPQNSASTSTRGLDKQRSSPSPSTTRSPRMNGRESVQSDGRRSIKEQTTKNKSSPSSAKEPIESRTRSGTNKIIYNSSSSSNNIKNKTNIHDNGQIRRSKIPPSSKFDKTLPTVSVEDHTEDRSRHTIIVVHDEDRDDHHTPTQWDQSHRYSLFDEPFGDEELDHLKSIEKSKNAAQFTSEKTKQESLSINYSTSSKENNKSANDDTNNNGDDDDDEDDNQRDKKETILTSPDPSAVERDLQPSALSMYSGSELTSAGTGTRSQSRQGSRKSRRLSVQTSGALRALSSVLSEESKQADKREADTSSYTSMMNALADVASSVEEQARKLDNVRRTGLSLVGRERQLSPAGRTQEGDTRTMRRASLASPERRNSSFVTNEVYKFLERRTSSKTMTRRQTLSKLELKLLSQAPGEDVAARRSSFSSLNSNHRGNLDIASNSSSARGSRNGSLADITTTLLDIDRQNRTPRRHSMSAVSERLSTASPRSASRLSNISENESSIGECAGGPGKTLRSYSWAPDVSETTEGHVLAMELLARNNRSGASKFRTVTHMLKWLGEEYRRQTSSMMYEELRYCTYLRLAPHQVPTDLKDTNVSGVFQSNDF